MKWLKAARAEQITPPGNWRVWLVLAGRGWGKTRTGAEDAAYFALQNPGSRLGVVAPTEADARDVCVEGESGLLAVLPSRTVAKWNRSLGEIFLTNGSRFRLFSADEPERLRGPQHHRVWCDEVGAWPSRGAFDQMLFGLRLGEDPRAVLTTTPRNREVIRELVARAANDVHLTHGRTAENAPNLAPGVLRQLEARYGGTRLGRQELDAELLDDRDEALWARGSFAAWRGLPPGLRRIVVAVDPALTSGAESDETGIIAAGLGNDGFYYVLGDRSGRYAPDRWAAETARLAAEWKASLVVAEVNAGGDLVERILRQAAPHLGFKAVRAVRGKIERALPVAALYEQGKIRHAGFFPALEEQMVRFSAAQIAEKSPDRVDALVWALTALSEALMAEPQVRSL